MHAWRSVLGAALLAAGAVSAQTKMEPGNWHLVTKATTNGKAEPDQVQDECLGDELKDLAGYFAPDLEGVKAKCTRTPVKSPPNSIAYKLRCTGQGFTMDAETEVRILGPKHFTATMKMDTKTPKERAIVKADIEGRQTGACKAK